MPQAISPRLQTNDQPDQAGILCGVLFPPIKVATPSSLSPEANFPFSRKRNSRRIPRYSFC